jgi:hypothetical protein
MFNIIVRAESIGAGAASRYGSNSCTGTDQMMRLIAAPARNTGMKFCEILLFNM